MNCHGQSFGFFTILLLGINAIIGSGIFLLPGQVMNLAGHGSLFVYLFVTLLVLSIAWCFAQCASLFDRNGGAYVYAKEAFGAFLFLKSALCVGL
jgi:amino acid transporter